MTFKTLRRKKKPALLYKISQEVKSNYQLERHTFKKVNLKYLTENINYKNNISMSDENIMEKYLSRQLLVILVLFILINKSELLNKNTKFNLLKILNSTYILIIIIFLFWFQTLKFC